MSEEGAGRTLAKESARLLRQADYTGALDAAERALEADPLDVDAIVNKAVAVKKMGRLLEALSLYEQALELRDDDPDIWFNRGLCARAMNAREAHRIAVESYSKAIELDPAYRDALQNLGNVTSRIAHSVAADAETQRRYYEMSEDAYSRAIELAPDSAELHYNRGNLYTKQLRLTEALESTEKALELDPEFAEAWYAKGYLLAEMQRPDEALEAYRRAVGLEPQSGFSVRAMINTGNILVSVDRPEEALEAYDAALAIDPTDFEEFRLVCRGNAWYNKAVLLKRMGREDEAMQAYDKAVDLRRQSEMFREPIKEITGPMARHDEHTKEG